MLPGPDEIIACPHCSRLARAFTLLSWNTFGATFWSDCKLEAPMFPQRPAVTKCDSCGKYYWISDAKLIGEMVSEKDAGEYPAEWRIAPRIRRLSREELLDAIEKESSDNSDKIFALRFDVWWAANDLIRKNIKQELSIEDQENMKKLAALLDNNNPEHQVVKAEIFRELGDFDAAYKLLSSVADEDYIPAANRIWNLCNKNQKLVAVVEKS